MTADRAQPLLAFRLLFGRPPARCVLLSGKPRGFAALSLGLLGSEPCGLLAFGLALCGRLAFRFALGGSLAFRFALRGSLSFRFAFSLRPGRGLPLGFAPCRLQSCGLFLLAGEFPLLRFALLRCDSFRFALGRGLPLGFAPCCFQSFRLQPRGLFLPAGELALACFTLFCRQPLGRALGFTLREELAFGVQPCGLPLRGFLLYASQFASLSFALLGGPALGLLPHGLGARRLLLAREFAPLPFGRLAFHLAVRLVLSRGLRACRRLLFLLPGECMTLSVTPLFGQSIDDFALRIRSR